VEDVDDRITPLTRAVAVLVAPILTVAGVMLYALPAETERLWAWPMGPELTVLAVGGGYLAGAVLFIRAARASRWHHIAFVFPAASVLTVLLLVATLLHWELFSHDHVSFWTWLIVYLVTPVLLPTVWWRNRRHDPGSADPGTPLVPRWVRLVVGLAGAFQTTLALVFFVWPATAIAVWPWQLSPLTARTLAAFYAFIGVLCMSLLVESRWSALRLHVQSAVLGLLLVGVGALRVPGDLTGGTATTAAFVVLLSVAIVGLVALDLGMRRAEPAAVTVTD
jgi:hypothetical protein